MNALKWCRFYVHKADWLSKLYLRQLWAILHEETNRYWYNNSSCEVENICIYTLTADFAVVECAGQHYIRPPPGFSLFDIA